MVLLIFHELSEIIRNKYEIKNKEKLKCVFTIPSYWNEKEMNRFKILLDESEFECLTIIPSYYSSVLAYGYENNNDFDECDLKYILLCDIGYINNDYTLVCYRKNKFEILNHINGNKNNSFVNGQKIDDLLLKEFENRCLKEGYNINEKGLIKLRKEVIKMKEKLSASGADEIQLTVELDEDKEDFTSNYSRNDMNELLTRNRFDKCIENNIEELYKVIPNEIKMKINPIIVGGSCRIPLFKSILCSLINKDALLYKSNYNGLIQTLNLDECISEGCCVEYMIDNNYFKVNCDLFREEKEEKIMSFNTTLTTSVIGNYLESINKLLDTDMENKKLSIFKNDIEALLYHYKRNVNEICDKMKDNINDIDKDIAWIKDKKVKTMDECQMRYEQIESHYSNTDKIIV